MKKSISGRGKGRREYLKVENGRCQSSGWGIHVNTWLIQVNVWQNPLQYCKLFSLQLIKLNGKKKATGADAGCIGASVVLAQRKGTGVCHQRRMMWILLASDCRDTGESIVVRWWVRGTIVINHGKLRAELGRYQRRELEGGRRGRGPHLRAWWQNWRCAVRDGWVTCDSKAASVSENVRMPLRERRQEKTFSELHKPFWTQLHLKAQWAL